MSTLNVPRIRNPERTVRKTCVFIMDPDFLNYLDKSAKALKKSKSRFLEDASYFYMEKVVLPVFPKLFEKRSSN